VNTAAVQAVDLKDHRSDTGGSSPVHHRTQSLWPEERRLLQAAAGSPDEAGLELKMKEFLLR
jgi:hypothetical protein